ncbi:MAG: hypothetical protein KGS61_19630, partial [Verrucomicrobia bacterium]|nr:hypothetical protein [Verrucomicrobiota bacterium]
AMSTGDALHYQWRFNGTNLPGQTNAAFMLSAMQPMMAGEYSVIVSNLVGVVANPRTGVAMLTMQMQSGGGPHLTLYGPMNGHYRIDQTPSLGPTASWSTLTNFSLTTNPYQAMIGTGSGPTHFYRAASTPEP